MSERPSQRPTIPVGPPAREHHEQLVFTHHTETHASPRHRLNPETKRRRNEDRARFDPPTGLGAIIDGTGGEPGGSLAAATALEACTSAYLRAHEESPTVSPEEKRLIEILTAPASAPQAQTDVEAAMRQQLLIADQAVASLTIQDAHVRREAEMFFKESVFYGEQAPQDEKGWASAVQGLSCAAAFYKIWHDAQGDAFATVADAGNTRILVAHEDGTVEYLTREDSLLQALEDAGLVQQNDETKVIHLKEAEDAFTQYTKTNAFPSLSVESALFFLQGKLKKLPTQSLTVREIKKYYEHINFQSLGLSRKKNQPSPTPHVKTIKLRSGDRIIAHTDGLDLPLEKLISRLKRTKDPILLARSLKLATIKSRAHKTDDITVTVVQGNW